MVFSALIGYQGPRRRDIPDPVPGCPGQKLYARRLLGNSVGVRGGRGKGGPKI